MKKLWEKFNNSHFLKFVFVGGLNTAIGYGVFTALILFRVHYVAASIIGHVTGVINSYFWNKYFTFRVPGQDRREILRFIGVYTVQYVIGLGGLILLVERVKLHPIPAQALVLIVTTMVSFFGHKHWTFRASPPAPPLI